jgi:negative regulator of sigma E activity
LTKQKVTRISSDVLETLSALKDGEASELEIRRVLKVLEFDSNRTSQPFESLSEDIGDSRSILNKWRRYQIVSDLLHQGNQVTPKTNLLQGIRAGLKNVEPPRKSKIYYSLKLLSMAGQGAIAASVAFTVLFLGAQLGNDAYESQLLAKTGREKNSLALPKLGGEFNSDVLTRTVSVDAREQNRIRQAVLQYSHQPFGQNLIQGPFAQPYVFSEEESSEGTSNQSFVDGLGKNPQLND